MKLGPPTGKISKYIDEHSGIRATVVDATHVVREMQTIQQTYPIATMLVGRSMVAAALMASQFKDSELVSVYFRGDGPIEMVFAEASYEGAVRGYANQPQLELPMVNDDLDLKGALGSGTMSVVRTNPHRTQPYRGTVAILNGQIGDEVAHYLHQSQQTRSVVALGVKVSAYGQVLSAGGIIIELMPDATDETAQIIENRVRNAGSLSEAIAAGKKDDEIMQMYLSDFKMREVEHPFAVNYICKCSEERLYRSLEVLPVEDLDEILAKEEAIKAVCEFCGRKYVLPTDRVREIRNKKFRSTLH